MNDPALQEAMRLAITLEDAGRLDEAQAAYRQVLALDGEFLPAICGLADTLIKAGRYGEAVESYRTIIARPPVFPWPHPSRPPSRTSFPTHGRPATRAEAMCCSSPR